MLKFNTKSVVGIDFDNTLINYDEVFYQQARNLNLISPKVNKNKKEVRDQIRLLPDGEIIWQKLQAFVYSKGISGASLNPGADTFIRACIQNQVRVYVISHKTEYSRYDEAQTNLRQAALGWMEACRFFKVDGLGLARDHVYFESTRLEKISRLSSLGCAHFIDDLEEVFQEDAFPKEVDKILFAPQGHLGSWGDIKAFQSWERIYEYFFG